MGYLLSRITDKPGFRALFYVCFICLYPSDWNVSGCFGDQPAGDDHFGIPYEVKIEGVPDRKLLVELEEISDTVSLKSRSSASLNRLRRRVERDRGNFLKIVKAQGYYSAQVKTDLDLKAKPVQVTFRIDTGPYSLFKAIEFQIFCEEKTSSAITPDACTFVIHVSPTFAIRGLEKINPLKIKNKF